MATETCAPCVPLQRLRDGQSTFANVAVDSRTAQWLREEHYVYQHVDAAHLLRLLGWNDDHSDRPILPLEDLSQADWPPPWTQPRIERVLALISAVAATTPLCLISRGSRIMQLKPALLWACRLVGLDPPHL